MDKPDIKLVVCFITSHCSVRVMAGKWSGVDGLYQDKNTEVVQQIIPDISSFSNTEAAVILQLVRKLK